MLRSLTSAISGLQNFQQKMDVIGNNVANVNTTGFKAGRLDMADSFSATLRGSSASTATSSSTSAMQIGSGVTASGVKNLYTQGALARTGVQTDLAIADNGWFVVRDPVNATEFVTRAGDFRVTDQGYLVTNGGMRVQGFSNGTSGAIGDLLIDATGAPTPGSSIVSWAVNDLGEIRMNMSDGSQFVRGQILLQHFQDPQGLTKVGNNLWSSLGAAGPLGGTTPTPAAAGTNGLGRIQAGALELSNVDLASEFTNLIITQRAYQSNARIITTSDEMLQELVNLKR